MLLILKKKELAWDIIDIYLIWKSNQNLKSKWKWYSADNNSLLILMVVKGNSEKKVQTGILKKSSVQSFCYNYNHNNLMLDVIATVLIIQMDVLTDSGLTA